MRASMAGKRGESAGARMEGGLMRFSSSLLTEDFQGLNRYA